MLAPDIVGEKQVGCRATRAQYLPRGFQKSTHLVIAVGRLLDRIAVDAKRDVVEEQPAVHLGHVDPALNPVTECVERAGHVMPVHPDVEREVVARPGRNANERKLVRGGGSGHDSERPVTTSHSEGICTAGYCCLRERCQVLARSQDDNLDTLLARPLNDPVARGRTPTRPGIDAMKTSDAVTSSSGLGNFLADGWERGGFVVLGACAKAVVQAAEEASEQVALGGGVPVTGLAPPVVVVASAG